MPTAARALPMILLALSLQILVSPTARADEPLVLSLYAGAFEVKNTTFDNPEAGVELRFQQLECEWLPEWLPLAPILGAAGTEEGNFWIYGGLRYDWQFGSPPPAAAGAEARASTARVGDGRFGLAISLAVSYYEAGDGRDLGGPVEFRSYGEVNLRVGRAARIGLGIHHLSNAGIYDPNPGSESLLLSLSFPLGER